MAYNTSLAEHAFAQFGMGDAEEKKKAATLARAVSNEVNKQNASTQTTNTKTTSTTNQNKQTKQNTFDDNLFLEGFNSARDRDWREEQQSRMQKFGIGMPFESIAQKKTPAQQPTSDKLTPEDEKAFLEGFNKYRDEDKAEQAKLQKARQAYADMQNRTPKDTLRGMMNGAGIQQPTGLDSLTGTTIKNGDLTPEGERAFLEGFNQYRENVEQPQKIYLQDGSAYDTLYGIDFESLKNSKSLDTASNLLAAASAIPMADTFTNLASIPVDLLRGDYISAGLDLLGVIPFAGEIADVAKTARTADRIIDGARAADKTIDVVKTADKAVDALEAVDDANDAVKALNDAVDIQKVSDSSGLIQTHRLTKSKKQFAELLDDISNNGIKEPIKYVEHNGEKYVVDGHHRLRIARILGLDEIPIQKVDLPYKGYYTADDLFWMK